ncbi:MAG: IS200/IS605 family transposase [Nanoarchaeota archaeon]|nr:IS200/IS605 family transposase [Nanoarchaeota archaeon]
MDEIHETYKRTNHSVGNNFWHFEWKPKYAYSIFMKAYYKNLMTILLHEGAKRYNIEIVTLNVQPDHLHMIASLPRGMTDIKAEQLLKGYTARVFFLAAPKMRLRYPQGHLWSKRENLE